MRRLSPLTCAVRAACDATEKRPPGCIYPKCRRKDFICYFHLDVKAVKAAIAAYEEET
jgi:hypothetical protein